MYVLSETDRGMLSIPEWPEMCNPPASASKAQGLQAQSQHCLEPPLSSPPFKALHSCAVQNTVELLGFKELCLPLLLVLGLFIYLIFGCNMYSSIKNLAK